MTRLERDACIEEAQGGSNTRPVLSGDSARNFLIGRAEAG